MLLEVITVAALLSKRIYLIDLKLNRSSTIQNFTQYLPALCQESIATAVIHNKQLYSIPAVSFCALTADV